MSFVNPVNNPHFCSQLYAEIEALASPSCWLLVYKEGEGFRLERKDDYAIYRVYRWCRGVSYNAADNTKILLEKIKAAKEPLERKAALRLCFSLTARLADTAKKGITRALKEEGLSLIDQLFPLDGVTLSKREVSLLLNAAIKKGREQTALKLISLGPDLEWKTLHEGYTHLHQAIQHNLPTVVEALVQKRAPLHAVDNEQNSPLHAACQKLQIDTALLLVKHGADVSKKKSR